MIVLCSIEEIWAERALHLAALSVEELARFATLRLSKQKRQFLAGRVAAKRALAGLTGASAAAFAVLRDADGVPVVMVDGGARPDLCTSISHAGDLAAAVASAEGRVGIDVERVEAREESFLSLVFSAAERARIGGDAREATFAWCEKEAVGKLRGVGLSAPFADLYLSDGTGCSRELVLHRGEEHAMVVARAR